MQLNINKENRIVDIHYEIKRQKMNASCSPNYMLSLYNLLFFSNIPTIVYDSIHWQIQELEDMVQIS